MPVSIAKCPDQWSCSARIYIYVRSPGSVGLGSGGWVELVVDLLGQQMTGLVQVRR
jgi:hypothetical protein